ARERKQFGRPLASFQLVQDMIARMAVDRDAARLLVYRAGDLKDRGIDSTLETSIAKYFASEAAVRAAGDAIQVHGASGYSNAYPVERYLRDAKVATIYEGTSQIQKLIIGEHLLGVRAFT
ncbi:MAG TPA: acyl-CoA dehydrogenase family protein, partial [Geobacteraceae bacterium]|nr:acyl-CoA dehydrogenase family protein [Geobacteraceae bacterium]